MSKIFVDTNILIYAFQSADIKLQTTAREQMKTLESKDQGVISTQVMQEFFVVATKKMGVDPIQAKKVLAEFENFEVLAVTPTLIYEAIDCTVTERISFWDALIVAAAQSSNSEQLWTEDLNDGQLIRGVRVVNPLVR